MLLGRRSPAKKAWAGCWDIPGGHVEAGESLAVAFVREIEEEIGVVPRQFELIDERILRSGEQYGIFRVDAWSGGEPALCNREHTELRWVTAVEACALRPLVLRSYPELFRTIGERQDRK